MRYTMPLIKRMLIVKQFLKWIGIKQKLDAHNYNPP
jgi:hypothetical protein